MVRTSKVKPLGRVLDVLEARDLPSFAAPISYNVGTQNDPFVPNAAPINVATADFNGDGKLDLAVVHTADSSVNILLNTGDGHFQPAVRYAVGEVITSVFIADFTGDGRPDLAVPGGGTSGNNFTAHAIILPNQGKGTFGAPIDSSSFGPSRGFALGDFNGDGRPDLAATNPTAGTVSILLGIGNGSFQPAITSPQLFLYSRWVTAGDFNRDGNTDLAIADGIDSAAELTILLGHGNGTFTLGGHYASPPTPGGGTINPEDVFASDLNGDGKLDLIECEYDHNINVFLGNGDGTVQPAVGVDTGEYPRGVAVADVNSDGNKDLVVANVGNAGATPPETGSVAVLLGNGTGTFQAPIQYAPSNYPGWLAVADFNGDGSPDLAVTRVADGHSVNVMMNGAVTTPPHVAATSINGGAQQRSRVTSLTITFDSQVSFAFSSVASAFVLTRNGGGTVSFTANASVQGGVTVVTLNGFTGSETEFGSLKDGRYTLTAEASQIRAAGQQLDGDGNGNAGGDYTFGDAQGLFRMFGDATGDRHVDIADFALFSATYGLGQGQTGFNAAFDFNGDGHIDIADFGQFSIRMFTMLP